MRGKSKEKNHTGGKASRKESCYENKDKLALDTK